MKLLRRTFRLIRLFTHLLHGMLLTLLFSRRRQGDITARFERIARWWSRRLCRILGLQVTVRGLPATGPALYVANHISWVDIPVLHGIAPAHLVSKAELRAWPLVGWLASRSGTLFIRRGERNAASETIERITWFLRRGRSILVFAEGTTGTGEAIKRFRPRLFAAATLSKRPVQPVAIRYPAEDEAINPLIPFVGDDAFVPHLLRLLGQRSIPVVITFCPVIASTGLDRRVLAARTQHAVAEVIGLPVAEPNNLHANDHGSWE